MHRSLTYNINTLSSGIAVSHHSIHTSLPSPSTNRTCRFPAYGSPVGSCLGHTQSAMQDHHSQINQAKIAQMSVKRFALWWKIGPLAPSSQMPSQPNSYVEVHISKSLTGIPKGKVITPPSQLLVQVTYKNCQGFETVITAGHLPHSLPLSSHCLLRGRHIEIPLWPSLQITIESEAESQKVKSLPAFPY